MPNNYFQFKQFRIDQGDCAMKVTTEGCLFGALITKNKSPKRILDIGTGTGLLALMLAQKFPAAEIDAVEIEHSAFEQATSNFQASVWHENINAYFVDIRDFQSKEKYDLIVSNPPFFRNSLLGLSDSTNTAKHQGQLNQSDLLNCVERLLDSSGEFWVIYPEKESKGFDALAENRNFFLKNKISVLNQPNSSVFREIQSFSKIANELSESTLIIKENGKYTSQFEQLVHPFYLNL